MSTGVDTAHAVSTKTAQEKPQDCTVTSPTGKMVSTPEPVSVGVPTPTLGCWEEEEEEPEQVTLRPSTPMQENSPFYPFLYISIQRNK